MAYTKKEIKKGIKLHFLKTDKFKTDLVAILITTPLKKETVTKNAVLTSVLRRGSKTRQTMDKISIELENMYGAEFDCGIEKLADNHILKFYLESVNDSYIPEESNVLEKNIEIISEIALDPYVESNRFKQEYVLQEKENIKQLIEGKKDDKDQYAFERCIEEMYKEKPHGIYRYGYLEDLNAITPESLYEYYKELIKTAKIDIFISGELDNEKITNYINNISYIKNLNEREPEYIKDHPENETREEQLIEESLDITQGKLVLGLKIDHPDTSIRYAGAVYNAILGGSANSKLFQNVREKESLAYTIGSRFIRQKNNIYIKGGIDLDKFDKALEVIKQQMEDIKKGNFSEEEINNAKIFLESNIKMLEDEQDLMITYYIGQELSDSNQTVDSYLEEIKKITKQQIIEIANKTIIDTIYFLKNI